MLRETIHNLLTAKRARGSLREKLSTFSTLTKLSIKKRRRAPQREISEYFGAFKVFGFSYLTLDFLFREVFISDEYFLKSDTKSPIIIDCGANIGDSTLYFKKLFPDAKILAFEPNPHAFALLKKNIKVNQLTNIECYNAALSNKKTAISFYIESDLGTLIGSVRKDRGGQTKLTVKTERLSDYLEKIPLVDLIKIDVEGAEVSILKDLAASGTLNRAKEYIIEYHHNIGGDKSQLSHFLRHFEDAGFNYNIKALYLRENPFQDILLHIYKS